jgi:hypothetical protein
LTANHIPPVACSLLKIGNSTAFKEMGRCTAFLPFGQSNFGQSNFGQSVVTKGMIATLAILFFEDELVMENSIYKSSLEDLVKQLQWEKVERPAIPLKGFLLREQP